jgi:hypothetical protein
MPRRALALLLLLAVPVAARTPSTLRVRFPSFQIPPGGNVEACAFVRLPVKTPFDVASWEIRNRGSRGNFAARHFLVYLYTGTEPQGFPPGIDDSRGCLDRGPADRNQRQLIAFGSSVRNRGFYPPGVALRVGPPPGLGVGVLLDAEWVNGTSRTHTASTLVLLRRARRRTVRRTALPIFERTAEQGLSVAPGTVGSTEASTAALGASASSDAWRSAADACLVSITGHMHKRGRFFGVDLLGVDGVAANPPGGTRNPIETGRTHFFGAFDYTDPGALVPPSPQLVRAGEALHYTCWDDNGFTTAQRLGCAEVDGVVPGVARGLPGGGAAKPCMAVGEGSTDCPATDPAYPGRRFTGACVAANLVAGEGPDDEVCALAGFYFDAADGGCDVSNLPPLP